MQILNEVCVFGNGFSFPTVSEYNHIEIKREELAQ